MQDLLENYFRVSGASWENINNYGKIDFLKLLNNPVGCFDNSLRLVYLYLKYKIRRQSSVFLLGLKEEKNPE